MANIDTDFQNITKEAAIQKYLANINKIREHSLAQGFDSDQFHEIVLKHFSRHVNYNYDRVALFFRKRSILILLVFVCCFLYLHKHETASIILRNIQAFIFPGMKLWRKLTLPIISRYPALTEYYDESCLVSNPLFQVMNLTCEPCMEAANVLETSDIHANINNTPFMFRASEFNGISMQSFKNLYAKYESHFKQDAYKIESSNPHIQNLDDLFRDFNEFNRTQKQTDSHNLLRCNRMGPARILRKLFPKPTIMPNTGISLERFLAVDTPRAAPYRVPDTECSNVFIVQGYGKRIIILRPTVECRSMCRTLSVLLPPSYVLIYNWWYWKPISMPDKSSYSYSMSYFGSFC